MAQLMFKIANQPHPDIRTLRPDVPDCLANVIDRAAGAMVMSECDVFIDGCLT